MATTHKNNFICIGINPNSWNDTSVRAYLGDDGNSVTNVTVIPFVGADQAKYDAPLVIGRNKMIIKINYPIKTEKTKVEGGWWGDVTYTYNDYTAPKTSIWLNGQNVCVDFTPSDALKQEYVSGGTGLGWTPDEGYTTGNWDAIIGEITLSNVEGTNRFYGTYHEISHITQEGLTNDDFVKLTKK